jgi:hypothetical protein
MARKKAAASSDEPRPSKALRSLREALGLGEEDWRSYLRHALRGFAEYEKVQSMDQESALRLGDVPDEWWEDPDALGYVTLRVMTKGAVRLKTPVARHFLQVSLPGPRGFQAPPGIGLAWLHLARQGLDPPVSSARLVYLALHMPTDFFHSVGEEDLLPLGRLILEGRGAIEAWDVHALIAAVDLARISVHAPFRLFNELMAADWMTREVKREFCRGLLACSPEALRIKERGKAIDASIQADPKRMWEYPRIWTELTEINLQTRLPVLQRHAVRALVEEIGEPLGDVLAEFYLRPDRNRLAANAVTEGALDLVRNHAEELGTDEVRSLLRKAIKRGTAEVRQAAYRVGAALFGLAFARPALRDDARMVSHWASKLLAKDSSKSRGKSNGHRGALPSNDE